MKLFFSPRRRRSDTRLSITWLRSAVVAGAGLLVVGSLPLRAQEETGTAQESGDAKEDTPKTEVPQIEVPKAGVPKAGESAKTDEPGKTKDPAKIGPVSAQKDLDTLKLLDGSTQFGRVSDPGGSSIQLEYRGASRKFLKSEIESIEFFKGRQAKERLETDLVILKLNQHHVRCKILRETGREVRVELPNGARTTYARERVQRVMYRDQIFTEASQNYNQDLESDIRRALELIRGDDEKVRDRSEKLLVQAGIFAIESVERSLTELGKLSPEEREVKAGAIVALSRVLHTYGLKKVTAPEIEEMLPSLYDDLAYGDFTAKASLLKVIFSRFADESPPLALFLISNSYEDARIRAMCVEILRRLNQNRALVTLYNQHSGQLQFVAAVALARNRIYVGVPTLIDALELGSQESQAIRRLAAQILRETTGQNFEFRADSTPAARDKVIAKWRDWWGKHERPLYEKSRLVLEKKTVQTIERRESLDLWKKAHEFVNEKKHARAAIFLREAMKRDPTFHKAHVSLAVLLYSVIASEEKDVAKKTERFDEAERILDDLSHRSLPEITDADRHWIHYELGCIYLTRGKIIDALDELKTSLALEPTSISSMLGIAACHWELATSKSELIAGERKIELRSALRTYIDASQAIRGRLRTIQVLSLGDVPNFETLPFQRRDYNRNVLAVRADLEATSVELFIKIARIYRLQGGSKRAVLALREGLDTLKASTELNESATLEIALRTQLGNTYEAIGKDSLALAQYGSVLKGLDPKNKLCLRGYARVRRSIDRKEGAVTKAGD
jgi:tetratricopeptide (TPR) repeat protein